jgi:nitric oxide reductase NorQ protein
MAAVLTKTTTLEQFESSVDDTTKIITDSGLVGDRAKVRKDMLARFAQSNSMSVTDAEVLLQTNSGISAAPVTPEPKVAPAPVAPVKRKTREEREAEEAAGARPYFWVKPEDKAFLSMWVNLRRGEGLVANLLVTGPTGAGKTEGVKNVGAEHEIPVYKVDCASITTADKWVGHKEVDEKGTHYVLSEHLRWISADGCEPGIVLYDELTRLHPSLLNLLIPILDGSQSIWVPELGINVNVHPDTMFVATANIGAGYSGTYRLDDAIAGRFGFRIEQDFPPIAEEVKVLMSRTGIEEPKAKMLVDIANQTRQKSKNSELGFPVSTRNLIDTANLVASGQSVVEAANFTFITMYSEDGGAASERVIVRQIVAGKAGGR